MKKTNKINRIQLFTGYLRYKCNKYQKDFSKRQTLTFNYNQGTLTKNYRALPD